MPKQKSIVLITVDCLRADHVGFMGYSRPTTPFFDTLVAESFVIPSAIVAGAPTYYSFPGILAARYPLALGRDVLGLAPDEPTLASVLRNSGYRTAAFAAANPYISARFGYGQGFETFRDFLAPHVAPLPDTDSPNGVATRLNQTLQKVRSRAGPLGIVYDELYFQYCQRSTQTPDSLDGLRRFPSADVIVDNACQWLSTIGDAPFFLWLHLMDPHGPYYPKVEALKAMGDGPLTPFRARYLNSYWNRSDLGPRRLRRHLHDLIGLYDAGIRWVDLQLSRLVGTLQRNKRWDDCIFSLTADHGEQFLEHGGRYHAPSNLMEEVIHVPLLLRVPGTPKTQVDRSPFSLIYLAPTLMDAAQLKLSGDFVQHSRWNELQASRGFGEAAISESVSTCTNPFRPQKRMGPRVLSVRDSRFKLILHFDGPAEYFYDLESDPGEQAPLAANAQKAAHRRLLEIARGHLKASSDQRDPGARMRARVRDLQLEWTTPANNNLQAVLT
jgi:arylsulfatase A-like enzyme